MNGIKQTGKFLPSKTTALGSLSHRDSEVPKSCPYGNVFWGLHRCAIFLIFLCRFTLFAEAPVLAEQVSLWTVTTIAGSGAMGCADGIGNSASFRLPTGITIDKAGNLFVADTENSCIRKISPDGVVTTIAGTKPKNEKSQKTVGGKVADEILEEGEIGENNDFTDGTGAEAKFNHPTGIAIDGKGNLFIADTDNHRIRKITPLTGKPSSAAAPEKIGDSFWKTCLS